MACTGEVELQGYIVPRSANWECLLLFGRETEHQQGESMKRVGGLFDSVFTRENLYQAYLDARKGKRKKRACHRFEINLGANLDALHREIHAGTYRPRPYHKFLVHEPKERVIHAPAFRDIVVQHAVYRMVYEIFNRTFVATSFACRKGYGTHRASDYTQHILGRYDDDRYTLKLDIRKFFYSIDRDILRTLIERKIKDRRLLDIMMLFAHQDEPTGIPIGNLLSQLYALVYLNPLDQFVKRVLGVRHYVRYVDDFILFGLTLDQCREYRERIVAFLESGLRLRLSKSTIQKIRRGVNFVGYRTWKGCRLIRKHSLHRFRRSLKREKMGIGHITARPRLTDPLPGAHDKNTIGGSPCQKSTDTEKLPTPTPPGNRSVKGSSSFAPCPTATPTSVCPTTQSWQTSSRDRCSWSSRP